jgi:hypothetical protein
MMDSRRKKRQEVETQTQKLLKTLGLDQITKLVYRLDGPLGEDNL